MTHLQAAARSMLPLVFLGVCAQPFLKNSMPFPLHVLFVWAVITFAAFGFGHILLTAFRTPFAPGLESLVLKLGIGFGVLSYFTFWGGLMNWIYIWFFWVLLPMTLVTFCTTNAPWRTHGATSWERGEKILLFILLPMVLVNFYLALAPPYGS